MRTVCWMLSDSSTIHILDHLGDLMDPSFQTSGLRNFRDC
jgi:hypothetical protein